VESLDDFFFLSWVFSCFSSVSFFSLLNLLFFGAFCF
jgi:hypothetical protein